MSKRILKAGELPALLSSPRLPRGTCRAWKRAGTSGTGRAGGRGKGGWNDYTCTLEFIRETPPRRRRPPLNTNTAAAHQADVVLHAPCPVTSLPREPLIHARVSAALEPADTCRCLSTGPTWPAKPACSPLPSFLSRLATAVKGEGERAY